MKEITLENKSRLDFIKNLVEENLGVEVVTKSRLIANVRAKRLFLYLVDYEYGLTNSRGKKDITYEQIADYFNHVNHTSILHLIKDKEFVFKTDKPLEKAYNDLIVRLSNKSNVITNLAMLRAKQDNLLFVILQRRKELTKVTNEIVELEKLKSKILEDETIKEKKTEIKC